MRWLARFQCISSVGAPGGVEVDTQVAPVQPNFSEQRMPSELHVKLCYQLDRRADAVGVEWVGQLHMQFARHPLLGEVRLHGCDLGIHFYDANVRDATYALEACQASPQQTPVLNHLLQRLSKLRKELPQRAQALKAWGGPETLLHGDLWSINVFV